MIDKSLMHNILPLALIATATACGGSGDPNADLATREALSATLNNGSAPEGVTLTSITEGRILFNSRATCSACHGADGKGSQLAPSLADDVWLSSDGSYADLIEIIDAGVLEPKEYPGLMLPRGGMSLSDEEVSALAAFIWSLGVRG